MNELFYRGIEHFNNRQFYECHEALEELWLAEGGENKLFYQGLIQVAVAFYHYLNGNCRGALWLLRQGREKLSRYPPRHMGVNLERLLAETGLWQERMRRLLADERSSRCAEDSPGDLRMPRIVVEEDDG